MDDGPWSERTAPQSADGSRDYNQRVQVISYPKFEVPSELAVKSVNGWALAEARRYLIWFTSVLDERVSSMLEWLQEPDGDDRDLLLRVGEKATWHLRANWLGRRNREGRPSEEFYALASDLGMLLGQRLCRTRPEVQWEVCRTGKRDPSFNQPVLRGIGDSPFNPVLVSVAEAVSVAKDESDHAAWLKIYEYALEVDRDRRLRKGARTGPASP
jgi:hypothetical protein